MDLSFGEQRTLFVFDLCRVVTEFTRYEQLDASLARRDGIDEGLLDTYCCCGQGGNEHFRVFEFGDELGLIRVIDRNDRDSEFGEFLGCGRLDLRARISGVSKRGKQATYRVRSSKNFDVYSWNLD